MSTGKRSMVSEDILKLRNISGPRISPDDLKLQKVVLTDKYVAGC